MSDGDEDWLRLVGEVAREGSRRDAETLARMAETEEGRRLLAPMGEVARARIAATAFPAARRGWRARAGVIGVGASGALAAAAAFALWVGAAGRDAPLPAYEVAVSGPPSALRAVPAPQHGPRIELTAASPFEVVFRPDEDVKGPVAAEAFLVEGERVRAWDAPIEVSSEGAVRIAGAADALFGGRRGAIDVLVIVARPGALPQAARALRAADAPGDATRAARLHVTIAP
jgi:hypothetical protein